MKRIRVYVTAKDIREGVWKSCYDCPVAIAMSRRLKQPVVVYGGGWLLSGETATRPLPDAVADWTYEFDLRCYVRPIRFEVEI